MAIIWETTDRLGRPVVLTDEGREHVLSEHHSMVHRVQEVQNAVTFADEVVCDRAIAHREIHYREQGSGQRWLRHKSPAKQMDCHLTTPRDDLWEGELDVTRS